MNGPDALPPSTGWGQRVGRFAYPAFVAAELAAFLAVWELAAEIGVVNAVYTPPPTKVLAALLTMLGDGSLWRDLAFSGLHWTLGFAIASAVGVVLGLVMGVIAPIGRLISPIAWALYSAPFIVFQPMLIIWFGFGDAPIIALVVFSAVFPILLTMAVGVANVDRSIVNASRVFGATWLERQVKVTFPHALPFFVSGMRLAIPVSLVGMLIAELLGAPAGLGRLMAISSRTYRIDQTLAAVIVLIVLAALLITGFSRLERRFAPWRGDAH